MFVAVFFTWWYGQGWSNVANCFGSRLKRVSEAFSVNQLLNTLFAPWRRIISYPGASLAERFRASMDNLFSRSIGFVVRLIVLLTALIALFVTIVATLIELIIWPLLPLSIVGLIIIGVIW